MFTKSVATREKVKLMIGLTGPSGSGKTYSALQLAHGIAGSWGKILLADTENKSALYYAGEKTGAWEHVDFSPEINGGYHPYNWIKLISFAEQDPNISVLILDSISHEWSGVGGCLELQTKLGGRYQDWSKVTPLHTAFIDKMRNSRLHIIATMRSKQDYAVEQNDKGKAAPRKIGLAPTQREGTDYEFGIIFDIEMNHYCTASKDRTGVFSPRGSFVITDDIGKELLAWSTEGKENEAKSFDSSEQTKVEIFNPSNPVHKAYLERYISRKPDITLPHVAIASLAKELEGKAFRQAEVTAAWERLEIQEKIEREGGANGN